jgi:hypothetical protein
MRFPGAEGATTSRAVEASRLAQKIEDQLKGRFRLDWFDFQTALRPQTGDGIVAGPGRPDRTAGNGSEGMDPMPSNPRNTAVGDAIDAIARRQGRGRSARSCF